MKESLNFKGLLLIYMRFILFVLFLFPVLVCSQQILSLEEYGQLIDSGSGVPETVTYLKDINNSLDQFTGTWIGTQNGNTITFVITEATNEWLEGILIDQLLIRYKIEDSQGGVILDFINYLDDSLPIINGDHFSGSNYYLRYHFGHNAMSNASDSICGSFGSLVIKRKVLPSGGVAIEAVFASDHEVSIDGRCPNGIARIPIEELSVFELLKQ